MYRMPAGVYLHIPFCKSRCSYCDFATDVYRDSRGVERYVDAICREIEHVETASVRGRPVASDPTNWPPAYAGGSDIDTVYFGGGTPSLLSPKQVERILSAVRERYAVAADAEMTMEMNPATVTPEKLSEYRKLGVNRASFGVQTFDDRALKLLARGHTADDARQTFEMLRDAGFENVSFDLIAGLPHQTLADWSRNLDEAIALGPEHISLYLLEIHEGTPLDLQVRSGRQPRPDEDLAAKMYETMLDRLAAAGYRQYEISNFSRPGRESQHNTKYWTLDPVYGFGVSAHSFDGHERYSNERDTAKYVAMIERDGRAETTRETANVASEAAFLGLRLEHGIDTREFAARFGIDLLKKYSVDLESLSRSGLIEAFHGSIRLTAKGKLFSNEVFEVFV